MIIGTKTAFQIPLDVFPEFAPPLVEIQTEAPGLSAEEVESLITVPLENAVNGTAWLKTLRSKSVLGLSSVVCIFQEETDLMQARQLVQERIATIVEGRIHPLPADKEARKYMVEQLLSRGFTRREIAERLGMSRKSIYNILKLRPK